MSETKKIPPRVSGAILQSFASGVTPRIGLEHVVVGRTEETTALLDDFDTKIATGGASMRIVAGPFGSGKSFLLQVLRNYALQRNFIVADADLSPERRLTGTQGQGLALYRELLGHMATKARPEGGAFEALLEKWIDEVRASVASEGNVQPDDPAFGREVERKIRLVIQQLRSLTHSFDFATVLLNYWRGNAQGNDELKARAMRWLRGEYPNKSEAKAHLGVGVIIDDSSWYDYLKLFATFAKMIGYKGMVIYIDEAVNLYKISHAVSRRNNYERLLTIFNDVNQGTVQYMGFIFSATPQMIEDQQRGLYSYEALHSRLRESSFAHTGLRDFSGPIIRLDPLSNEELFVLLQKLREVHAQHHKYASSITDADITLFMAIVSQRLGAMQFMTPREMARDFLSALELQRQNPAYSFQAIIQKEEFHVHRQATDTDQLTPESEIHDADEDSPYARFTL